METEFDNAYSMVSLATDIYMTLNNGMAERDVPINITMIPQLCNLMAIPKIAQKGVYLGVNTNLSLMLVDDYPHTHYDFDIKFHEEVKTKFGIPFVERHVKLIKHSKDVDIPHIGDIFDDCRRAGFIVDEC